MNKKNLGIGIIALCFLFVALSLVQRLLVPKHVTTIVEGSMIEEYYEEEGDHDVIFVGDCEVYANISPIKLWENYGITSYIRGSAQQLIWQSYYILEETLKKEKPKVAVFNVLSMKYDEPQHEAYNRMTLDGMKFSMSKLKAINASMMEDEHIIEYLFPLLRYHSRWSELTGEDFKYFFTKDKVSHNGYYMRTDVKPVSSFPKPRKLPDYRFQKNAYDYLDKMVKLCKENDVELVLMKAPSLYPHWYDEWDAQMEEYAHKHGLMYINFIELAHEIGIDYNEDTYDAGLHLNIYGAEKLTDYFGKILKDRFDLEDRRGDEVLSDLWQKKIGYYNEMREEQLRELETYGYLKSLGASPNKD